MKYIITENKMVSIIARYLEKAFGNLTKHKNHNKPEETAFVKDDYIYMLYYSDDGSLFVDFNGFWDNINGFFNWKLKQDDLTLSIKIWAKNNYDIDVTNVYETYIRQTMLNGDIQ